MTLALITISAIAAFSVAAAYFFGRRDGIRHQKETTLAIIDRNTTHCSTLGVSIRNDAATVQQLTEQAEKKDSLFCFLFNISDEELAELS